AMPTRGFANQTGQGGEYRTITPKWPASTAVAPGDLVWWDTSDDTHKPMSSYVWNTNIATTAGAANAVFAGVSEARRLATQTDAAGVGAGMISYTGEFCFDCDALGAAVDPGALVSSDVSHHTRSPGATAVLAGHLGVIFRYSPPCPVWFANPRVGMARPSETGVC
ncbi:MAG TPA: hypothetical protein VM529_21510, partial [Gemmata sp.]|nr:hypothetical protein [Gemmata sp.]